MLRLRVYVRHLGRARELSEDRFQYVVLGALAVKLDSMKRLLRDDHRVLHKYPLERRER